MYRFLSFDAVELCAKETFLTEHSHFRSKMYAFLSCVNSSWNVHRHEVFFIKTLHYLVNDIVSLYQ